MHMQRLDTYSLHYMRVTMGNFTAYYTQTIACTLKNNAVHAMHGYVACQGIAQTPNCTDTDVPLIDQDYICTTCYNFHLLIVQNTESRSTDSEL